MEQDQGAGKVSRERTDEVPKKEDEEGPTKYQQQHTDEKTHVFQFRIGYRKYKVACNSSQTVIEALNANDAFMRLKDKQKDKEIIIQRGKGKVLQAAVKPDFPCCLLEDDEVLNISFINSEGSISTMQNERPSHLQPSKYNIFYIRTRGKIRKKIMKNNKLTLTVDYVCVYAPKGETLKTALEHDGRFSDEIFNNPCELRDRESIYELTLPVESLCEDQFEIYVQWQQPSPSNILSSANNESEEAPADPHTADPHTADPHTADPHTADPHTADPHTADPHTADLDKQPIHENPKKRKKKERNTEKHTGSSAKSCKIKLTWSSEKSKFPPFTEEILRDKCKSLLEKLKERENQNLIQVEYGKNIKNFYEVSTLRRLTKFADSVCVIVADKNAIGTGFVLVGNFILTNAHVVESYLTDERNLSVTLGAAFNYEHVTDQVECLTFKRELAACLKKKDTFRHFDYALLELDTDKKYPALLDFYKNTPPPRSGGIYIVGHPNCERKKLDCCLIIETEKQLQAINKHISEEPLCPYVSWQCWPELSENKITYDSCFFHGSSGSPVFDETFFLIGVHTGGFDYKDSNNETKSVIEYCYSMQSILESILETGRADVKKLLCQYIPVKVEPQNQEEQQKQTDVEMTIVSSDCLQSEEPELMKF